MQGYPICPNGHKRNGCKKERAQMCFGYQNFIFAQYQKKFYINTRRQIVFYTVLFKLLAHSMLQHCLISGMAVWVTLQGETLSIQKWSEGCLGRHHGALGKTRLQHCLYHDCTLECPTHCHSWYQTVFKHGMCRKLKQNRIKNYLSPCVDVEFFLVLCKYKVLISKAHLSAFFFAAISFMTVRTYRIALQCT